MDKSSNERCLELIETLREGEMLSHPGVKFHVDRAISTGDGSNLEEYLQNYPVLMAIAKRNIALAKHQRADNPFKPYPDPQEARQYLSGPVKLGFVNAHDDMFGAHFDIFSLPVMIPGRPGGGKSHCIKTWFVSYAMGRTILT